MSAFVIDADSIRLLAAVYVQSNYTNDITEANRIARYLHKTNVTAVGMRYPNDVEPYNLPGPIEPIKDSDLEITVKDMQNASAENPVNVLQLCRSYSYQTSEMGWNEYKVSDAFNIILGIESHCIYALRGSCNE